MDDLGGVVDHVGDQSGRAERLLTELGRFGVGYAAVMGIGADEEEFADEGLRRRQLGTSGAPTAKQGDTMGIITQDMRSIVDSAKLAFVATVCEDGSPNLSPKGSLLVYDDDHLVFMNMASPTTVANLRRDPRLEVNVIDFLLRRGYRFKGTAELRGEGDPVYAWSRQWVMDTHGPAYPCHEAVLIQVEQALPVHSPAYTFGHWSEADLKRAWADTYGLTHD